MKLSVAYAAGSTSFWQELDLASPITAEQAIAQSKLATLFNELDLKNLKVGIFGKVCPKNRVLEEGDRVEVYQPATAKAADLNDEDD
ncbi:RnfH family protein [Psychromonas antarctica]|jgi:putative ubiquitin-RnfH superfamily antitoxin RatB of RatAB toxin-antitoxin module|uniref:RnfH family protein n=1 Tax=Psychromonas antarctica TaxID=67573 RepID=UPI001EE85DF2|nr:RnfH family protein [Psychromonas antarctica]MCG6200824.1 RnfH family protein [Psychromonas antarctica]